MHRDESRAAAARCVQRTAVGDVQQDHGHAGDQAGDEAAARQVVAAQEDDTPTPAAPAAAAAAPAATASADAGPAPSAGPSASSAGRGRPAREQREDAERGDRQHGDLAVGVEAAEIHQDHVDDVGAAAAGTLLSRK